MRSWLRFASVGKMQSVIKAKQCQAKAQRNDPTPQVRCLSMHELLEDTSELVADVKTRFSNARRWLQC